MRWGIAADIAEFGVVDRVIIDAFGARGGTGGTMQLVMGAAIVCILLTGDQGQGPADYFNFYNIEFGMDRADVNDHVNKMIPNRPRETKLYKSTGGEWGDWMVDAPGHKILSMYFKFNKEGRLYWIKVHYPYSLSNPAKNKPLVDWINKTYVDPITRKFKDIKVSFDKRRVRLTLFYPALAPK